MITLIPHDDPIHPFAGKVRLYHGTTLKNFNGILKSGFLGQIRKGIRGKKRFPTFATLWPQMALQYATEVSILKNDSFAIVVSFIVDCDLFSSDDLVTIGSVVFEPKSIFTDEKGIYKIDHPIDVSYLKIHSITKIKNQ